MKFLFTLELAWYMTDEDGSYPLPNEHQSSHGTWRRSGQPEHISIYFCSHQRREQILYGQNPDLLQLLVGGSSLKTILTKLNILTGTGFTYRYVRHSYLWRQPQISMQPHPHQEILAQYVLSLSRLPSTIER